VTQVPHKSDPILDELHAIRRQMLEECGGDLAKLGAELREREKLSGHPLVPLPVSTPLQKSSGDTQGSNSITQ